MLYVIPKLRYVHVTLWPMLYTLQLANAGLCYVIYVISYMLYAANCMLCASCYMLDAEWYMLMLGSVICSML